MSIVFHNRLIYSIFPYIFSSGSEETKMAASYALGYLALGNMEAFLPVVLEAFNGSKYKYFLLASLKEVILVHANNQRSFSAYIDTVYISYFVTHLIRSTSINGTMQIWAFSHYRFYLGYCS
jgi:hypothetical protein